MNKKRILIITLVITILALGAVVYFVSNLNLNYIGDNNDNIPQDGVANGGDAKTGDVPAEKDYIIKNEISLASEVWTENKEYDFVSRELSKGKYSFAFKVKLYKGNATLSIKDSQGNVFWTKDLTYSENSEYEEEIELDMPKGEFYASLKVGNGTDGTCNLNVELLN